MEEQWKSIPEFPGYEVSNFGRVRSFYERGYKEWKISSEPQRILLPGHSRDGYRFVGLRSGNRSYTIKIASLVALAFIGPRPAGLDVCHSDDNKENDHLDNLRYDTRRENIADALKNGRMGKFCEEEINEMRHLYRDGFSLSTIAAKFEITYCCARDIVLGRTYKRLGIKPCRKRLKMDLEKFRELKSLYRQGWLMRDIGNKYNISESYVSRLLSGDRNVPII